MSTFVCVCRILSNARKRAKFAPPRPPSLAHFPHLFYNESMNTPDRNREMLALMQNLPKGTPLLLHSCCGPCSSRCLETLKETLAVTVLYYNPNITDPAEYEKRKGEQIRFLKETCWADFLDCDYTPAEFFAAAKGLEGEREGGARCYECYKLRLEYTARTAKERGFGWFCSTISVSPHKNSVWLNELGQSLSAKYGVKWLPNDFKKQNGYLRSVELAKEHNLYRQNYCGCVFSDWTKNPPPNKEQ